MIGRGRGSEPNNYLILRETMAADQLFRMLAPFDRTDLGLSVHTVQTFPRGHIPEANATVRCPPSRGQKVPLPRAPRNGLHRGGVKGKIIQRGGRRGKRRERRR